MAKFYPDKFIRMLRNEFRIVRAISILKLDTINSKGITRFRCPLCYGFHTATNHKTNLGRCFDCKKNFNPIDLVMTVSGYNFVDTVEFLKRHIDGAAKTN